MAPKAVRGRGLVTLIRLRDGTRTLPPSDPPLDPDGDLALLLARAREQVRLIDLAGDLVPLVEWFVYAFVRKEAVLSAQASLMDLLEVEASGEAPVGADVEEVCGYVDGLGFAWDELGSGTGLPISMRLYTHVARLEKRVAVLATVVRLLVTLIRVSGPALAGVRVPSASGQRRILHAVARAEAAIGRSAALRSSV